ncbi:MAG: hypothetical protein JNL74_24000, partial [Fibrobacteres bacterium]|nr:hypothetical protein [Fibrobacterota bacterium]
GTATDDVSAVDSVEVAIFSPDSSVWWHNGSWNPGIYWNKATGTANWNYTNTPGIGVGDIYWVIARSYDATGKVSDPDTNKFVFDNVQPITSITSPVNSTIYNASPSFAGTSTDPASGIRVVEVKICNTTDSLFWDGVSWTGAPVIDTATGTATWNYTMPSLTNGKSYSVTSRAIDSAGNTSSFVTDIIFSIDATAPSATLSSSAPATVGSTPFSVTVDFSEPVSSFTLANITVVNGTKTNLVNTMTDQQWTFDVTPTADGAVSIDIPAAAVNDFGSNPNTASNTLSRTADMTPPVSAVTTPVPGSSVANVSFVGGTASDANGITLVQLAIIDTTTGNY